LPECLIATTILAGDATVLDKRIDSPVLYSNSEELYIHNILQGFREQYSKIDDCLIYYFLEKLADLEKLDKIENSDTKNTVFFDQSGKTYCVKRPEANKIFE
jgi:Fe2+ or Zn2+ uptake regulation protein